jgi:hypothetical protein
MKSDVISRFSLTFFTTRAVSLLMIHSLMRLPMASHVYRSYREIPGGNQGARAKEISADILF